MSEPSRFKFRAWDARNEEMFDVSMIEYLIGGIQLEDGDPVRFVGNDLVLLQSTGLLDKNGVEIFEGDMFRYTNERGESATLEVVWFEHGWYGALPGCKDDHEYDYEIPLWNIPKEYEVIGNIYANPEIK